MVILKVKSKAISETERRKFVGVFLPRQVSSYLSLYALSKETAKSVIIRDQMEEWYRGKKAINSEKELIATIVNAIKRQWKGEKTLHPNTTFSGFRAQLEIELEKKGIDRDSIDAILIALNQK